MSAVLASTAEEAEDDWAMYHLSTAAKIRAVLSRMVRGSPEYADEQRRRHLALEQAGKHVARLRTLGCPLSPELAALAVREGLQ